jgi:excisionase family DNA binding protein
MSEWDDLLHALTAERLTSRYAGPVTLETHNRPPAADAPSSSATGADRLLRVEEAAGVLGVGRTRVYQLISTGELASVTIGRSRRITSSALQRYIAGLT